MLHVSEVYGSKFTGYIEVNGSCFKNIMECGYLNVGWYICKVYEDIKVMRCFKCAGFNHKIDRCSKEAPICGNCAGQHLSSECVSEVQICAIAFML